MKSLDERLQETFETHRRYNMKLNPSVPSGFVKEILRIHGFTKGN